MWSQCSRWTCWRSARHVRKRRGPSAKPEEAECTDTQPSQRERARFGRGRGDCDVRRHPGAGAGRFSAELNLVEIISENLLLGEVGVEQHPECVRCEHGVAIQVAGAVDPKVAPRAGGGIDNGEVGYEIV